MCEMFLSHLAPSKVFQKSGEYVLVTLPFEITAVYNNTPERYVQEDDGNFPVHG